MVLIMCSMQWSVPDARNCVQLHLNLCTPEWDLPGMGSDCNNNVSTPWTFRPSCFATIHVCIKKTLQVSSNKLWFWCCNGRFIFKLQNFKKVKLIFGHPVRNHDLTVHWPVSHIVWDSSYSVVQAHSCFYVFLLGGWAWVLERVIFF